MNVDWDTSSGHAPRPWYPPPPKRKSPLKIVFAIIAVAVALLMFASCMVAIGKSHAPKSTPPAPYPYSAGTVVPSTAVSSPEPAEVVTPAGPASVFGEGQFEVGIDVKPGKYHTTGPVESGLDMCYVERSRNASGELGSIIANSIVHGAHFVTIKVGEFVKNTGCQPFQLIG